MTVKLNSFSLLWLTLCAIRSNGRALLLAMIAPALIAGLISVAEMYLQNYILENSPFPEWDEMNLRLLPIWLGMFVSWMVVFFVGMFAVSCHQVIVSGSSASTRRLGFSWSLRVFKYFLWVLVTSIPAVLAGVLVSLLITAIISFGSDSLLVLVPLSKAGMVLVLGVPVAIELAFLAVVGLVLPMVAVNGVGKIRDALALGRGYFKVLFFSLVIIWGLEYLLFSILLEHLYEALEPYESIFIDYFLGVLVFVLGLLNIPLFSMFYKLRLEDAGRVAGEREE